MQQEINIDENRNSIYNESNIDIKTLLKNSIILSAILFFTAFLFGRINIFFNMNDKRGFAPFGLAYLLAVFAEDKKKKYLITCLGMLAGYLSIRDQITEMYSYLCCVLTLSLIYFSVSDNIKKILKKFNIVIIFAIFICYGMLVCKYEMRVNLVLACFQIGLIIPVYYIIKYAINSLEDIYVKKSVSTEEIASICIMICLIISGIGDAGFYQYSLRRVLALLVIFTIAYCGGSAYGAMIGVTMGIVIGISTNDMEMNIAFFGIVGLVAGLFKDTGKIISVVSGIIMYIILGVYSNNLDVKLIAEVFIGAGLFMMLPKTIYRNFQIELNPEKRKNMFYKNNLDGIKEQFNLKVERLTDVMYAISKCLNETTVNNSEINNKGSSVLIENLADRSCRQCINRDICWKKEFQKTYVSFQTMINNYQMGEKQIPVELKNKCIKQTSIVKNTELVIKNYNLHEVIKEQLFEGRKILSQHICNIGNTLNIMLNNFKNRVTVCDEMEKSIKKVLNKNDVGYCEVFCYTDYNGRMKIRIKINDYEGHEYCNGTIIPILSKALKLTLNIASEEYSMEEGCNECVVTIEELPKYYIMSYAAVAIKDGEIKTGDYYSFGKTVDGDYTFILSDGMGSGNEAAFQSKSIVNLTEHLTEAGFDSSIIVNTINSIMSAKFSENEKYATLDLGKVNLYNGNISFIKMGAAPSFIKRNKEVKKIVSNNLPFGVIDEVEAEVVNENLEPGDIIVSVSDGILDINKLNAGDDAWLERYLKESSYDPLKLSKNILKMAKDMSKDIIKDDMTVIVSKMYCV